MANRILIKALLVLTLGFACQHTVNAQDQRLADSLREIYSADTLKGQQKLDLLRKLAFNEKQNLELSKQYAEELIKLSQKENDELYLYRGYTQLGNTHQLAGELDIALENHFKALEVAQNGTFLPGIGVGIAYMAIADDYSRMEDSENASLYYDKAISLLREGGNQGALANALYNAGDFYFNEEQYDRALEQFEESATLFKEIDHLSGSAYTLGDIGRILAIQGKNEEAKDYLERAIVYLEELQDHYPIAVYLISLSEIAAANKDLDASLEYANRSLELSKARGLKEQISEAHLQLYNLHELAGNHQTSLRHYIDYVAFRDSVRNIATVQQMANLRTDYEVAQKQIEVDLGNQRARNGLIVSIATGIGLILLGLLALAMHRRNQYIQKTKKIIEEEQARSEELLLNILPKQTAEELKEKGKVTAKKFESVSVLFTDFVGFTKYAEMLDPEILVKSMDFYYGHFDKIIENYGLEKIKTVGDSYMCAGGLPFEDEAHAVKIVKAAREIAAFVAQARKDMDKNDVRFDIRIGINSGPVVAGVVGTRKFAYDIWGDTVNVASRMENHSEAGKINISENTFALVKDYFECEARGALAIKNHGKIKMYFVEQEKASSKKKSIGKESAIV